MKIGKKRKKPRPQGQQQELDKNQDPSKENKETEEDEGTEEESPTDPLPPAAPEGTEAPEAEEEVTKGKFKTMAFGIPWSYVLLLDMLGLISHNGFWTLNPVGVFFSIRNKIVRLL